MVKTPEPARWSSQIAFYLAAIGASVGLGSIWRFPYLVGTQGGSAFILVFALACLVIAIPLLSAEFLIGRRSRKNPMQAAGAVAVANGLSGRWNIIGVLGTLTAFLIISYYTVIAGWVLAYAWECANGVFQGLSNAQVEARWDAFVGNPWRIGAWHIAFLLLVGWISAKGVNRGLEVANRWRAPALLTLLMILLFYSLATGDVEKGLSFAFTPHFDRITPQVVLSAVGQAFYATGVGMAMMIAYGAYAPPTSSLLRSAGLIVASIIVVSILAAIVIFPLVFRFGLDPAQGPELVFNVLPTTFAVMPGGRVFGTLFFLLLVLAALTPSIAGIEPTVAWMQERAGWSRTKSVITTIAAIWVVGIGSLLSFNLWADWYPLGLFSVFAGMSVFELADYISSNILLPIGAFLTAIFVGWRLPTAVLADGLEGTGPRATMVITWMLRIVCPLAIATVLVAVSL
jgi:NSS family neurotransmitter:Na+ symporter